MNSRTHVFFGTATAVAFSHFVLKNDIPHDFAVGAYAALGSVLPDVDHPDAWFSNHFPGISKLICYFLGLSGKFFGFVQLSVDVCPKLGRSITGRHTPRYHTRPAENKPGHLCPGFSSADFVWNFYTVASIDDSAFWYSSSV